MQPHFSLFNLLSLASAGLLLNSAFYLPPKMWMSISLLLGGAIHVAALCEQQPSSVMHALSEFS
jgi:hypothetical protein